MAIIRREISDRTFMGKMIKWLFILFNLLMAIWLIGGLASAGTNMDVGNMSEAEQAGTGLGIMIGVSMIGTIWVIGDVILGLLVLLTRRRIIIETEE
jgi:hypothetical protein